MAATVQLVVGPAGAGKTAFMLERYLAAAKQAPGSALWLAPTHRQVELVRVRLAVGGGLFQPNLWSMQDFSDEVVRANDRSAQPLSSVQRRLLAEEIVAKLHRDGALAHFDRVIETRGFADGIFALLAELKHSEIWPDQFAALAQTPKQRQCAALYARYQQQVVRHNLYDLEGRQWYARDLLGRGKRKPFEAVQFVFVDGFTDLTRTQREILDALAKHSEAIYLSLPDEPGEERAELFSRPRATRERLAPLRPEVEWIDGGKPVALRLLRRTPRQVPAGLAHLERQLFRPLKRLEQSPDATGISCIEAPGTLGEARMVARHIKGLLLAGTPADSIVVAVRDLAPCVELLGQVFREYGIPVDIEGGEPLARNPAVALLLRCSRLPDDDWPFAGVTALLRSTYFCPQWPEAGGDRTMVQQAEVLLRLLGEPRGREAYLLAVRRCAERPDPILEDEDAERSMRQHIHELAKSCERFLQRVFHVWDGEPEQATLEDWSRWLRRLASEIGLDDALDESERDGIALKRLWQELDAWAAIASKLFDPPRRYKRKEFQRLLIALTAEACLARTGRGPGRVRILSASLARTIPVPILFVLGLGERSFPRLAAPEPLFDEGERQAFKSAGLDFLSAGDMMPEEMLLFYQLATRASEQLVLSYAAVDEKGQPLLPSSFLTAVRNCFKPEAIATQRQQMLIEGLDRLEPLSPAEYRVRLARRGRHEEIGPTDLRENLQAAALAAQCRFKAGQHGPYDGLLRLPEIVAELHQSFGSKKILSPTALENYVACPFRFFLRHVMKLEPLEEPSESIEHTRRGQVFHRALSRLHGSLKQSNVHAPTEAVNQDLLQRMTDAVEEYVARAPSPASKVLWQLEGQRLLRSAARYGGHWQQFQDPWKQKRTVPRPEFFEIDFGLPSAGGEAAPPLILRADGIEVRISGRIDRVDVAECGDGVGFWIIDYKSGRSGNYTATDLRSFRKLQLTLYALAVERVLLTAKPARPLGLAYWMVTEKGPKLVLPGTGKQQMAWLERPEAWPAIRGVLEKWVTTLVAGIRAGMFPLQPRSADCTASCDYGEICRISQTRDIVAERPGMLPLPTLPADSGAGDDDA